MNRVEKPWGYELWWAVTDRYVGKLIHVNKGHALSLQYHNRKDETIYVHAGKVLFEMQEGDALTKRELRPGEAVHVPPPTVHRMTAIEDSDIFEVSTPETDDVVRRKVTAAATAGMAPILVVGEQEEGESAERAVAAQLGAWIADLPPEADVLVAYEPAWAIGRPQPAPPGHVATATLAVRGLLDGTAPRLAVISVGENPFGHPASETLSELESRPFTVLRTDEHGEVLIQADPAGWRVAG